MSGQFDKGYYSMAGSASRHIAHRDRTSHTRLKLRRQPDESQLDKGDQDQEAKIKRLRDQLETREKSSNHHAENASLPACEERAGEKEPSQEKSEGEQDAGKAADREIPQEKHKQGARLPVNPLLPDVSSSNGALRRWDDDIIFRTQSSGAGSVSKEKEFVNDVTRSVKHKNFLKKHIK